MATNPIECSSNGITYIKAMSKVERQQFMDSFDLVLCDCDGVVWETIRAIIPGSPAAINYLRSQGKRIAFVTNNSIFPVQEHIETFAQCNLLVKKSDIIHPAQTVCDYLKDIQFDGLIYCLASQPFKQVLIDGGLQLAHETANFIIEDLKDLHKAILSQEEVKAIVIDVDFNLNAAKLMRSHIHLNRDPECLLIGGAADPLIPFGSAGNIIGTGAFINIVAQAADRQPIILGKPGQGLRDWLARKYTNSVPPERVLFIGDSLSSDVRFGRMCGYQTLLVLTGATSTEGLKDLKTLSDYPDYVADCLGDLIDLI